MNKMDITFSAVAQNEAFARVAVSGFLLYLDPTVSELSDIKTAVSEAVTNCVIHGYENKDRGQIRLSCMIDGRNIHIEIEDFGRGIEDIELARKPLYTSRPNDERCGMGFTIMEAFMDDIEVSSTVGKGTKIVMNKRLSRCV